MAFSSSLFPFFRDVNGQPLTSRDKWGYPLNNKARYKGNSALAMLLLFILNAIDFAEESPLEFRV